MKKLFSNLNIFLVITLIVQFILSVIIFYFNFLNIQKLRNLVVENLIEFQYVQYSYLKIFYNFIIPIIFSFAGIISLIFIIKQMKIGYFLSLVFWLFSLFKLIITSINFNGNLFNEEIDYFYIILIFGINLSIVFYFSKKVKQFYFKTH